MGRAKRPADPRIGAERWEDLIYWIYLAPGFVFKKTRLHCTGAELKATALARLKGVIPCACKTCEVLSRPAAHRKAS